MQEHRGQIVERIIRRNGRSISEIALDLKVNRRTVYNWFTQPHLKSDVIVRVGIAIEHDFSIQFPKLFTSLEYFDQHSVQNDESDRAFWKDKYLSLLDVFNESVEARFKSDGQDAP